jgi:ketosteroid isomerase-like protein
MNTKRIFLIVSIVVAQVLAACGTLITEATSTPEPTSVPTSAPTANPEPADPTEIVQAFWDAVKAEDVEAAMVFVSEDVKCRGSCYLTGKDSFRAYIQGMIDRGNVTEISDAVVDGDMVTYFYKVLRNDIVVEENAEGESMQVLDGKIIFWNNLHF